MGVKDATTEYRIEPVPGVDADDVPPGYKRTEIGVIPENWAVAQLGALFYFSGGVSASRAQLGYEGYCYLHYGDIHTTDKTSVNVQCDFAAIPKLDVPISRVPYGARLEDGDVVFVDASEDEEGTSKHIVVSNRNAAPFISGLHTIVAKPKTDNVALNFRHFCFQSAAVKDQFRFYAVGTKVLGVSKSNIRKIWLPFPPSKAEQEAIAEALSDADALIESLQELIAKKRSIKQGAMQALLTGCQRLPGFSGEWHEETLGSIVGRFVGGGTPSRANQSFWGNEIPWITVKDLATFDSQSAQESITRVGLNNSASNLIPAGTLITSTRMALGKAVIYEVDVAINQDLKALFLKPDVTVEFVKRWFDQFGYAIDDVGGGSTVKGISISELKRMPISLPCPEEQTAIANVLSDMDAEIEALEARLAKTRGLKTGMMQALLTGRIRLI